MGTRRTTTDVREERLLVLGLALIGAVIWAPLIAVLVGA